MTAARLLKAGPVLPVDEFADGLDFSLDRFQREAATALHEGHSVVVAAPTGAGKTLVADYALAAARRGGLRALYTTPIKALSNQKFGDFGAVHGHDNVGLLTGDHSIRPGAPIVVMTTEVLRNMLYLTPQAVHDVGVVVLDEVHYLQDRYRGGVWEEVIINLPPEVLLVCLSATVSNAEEFAGWVETLRGDTRAVIDETRPVPLEHLYAVGDPAGVDLLPLLVDHPRRAGQRPNPDLEGVDRAARRRGRGRLRTPRRHEIVDVLDAEGMLPAIYFVFSRRGCDRAVEQVLGERPPLTTRAERRRIGRIIDTCLADIDPADLDALDHDRWRAGLMAGIASHHAGLVPPFREAVEHAFVEGLVKVVFATETLALGVNMPAKTVVVENLTKYTGAGHEMLTPGQYTQLAGRAGRRGIDDFGRCIVLWSPYVDSDEVVSLVSSRSYELVSSFRPTYNMAANLVDRFTREMAHHVVNSSFAQYQADRDVVRIEADAERQRRAAEAYWERAACSRGDIETYAEYLQERSAPRTERSVRRNRVMAKPGDVVVERGRPAVVLGRGGRGGKTYRVCLEDGTVATVPTRRTGPPVTRIELPDPFQPKSGAFREEVAKRLHHAVESGRVNAAVSEVGDGAPEDGTVDDVGERISSHPCHACADLEDHLRWVRRARRAEKKFLRLERNVETRSGSLSRHLDRVCRLLREFGHLEEHDGDWELTSKGDVLSRLYSECDLVAAEALFAGHLDGLGPEGLAAVVSGLTYEARRDPSTRQLPGGGRVGRAVREVEGLALDVREAERRHALETTRPPDDGFCDPAWRWAHGEPLGSVLGHDLTGGDFVRNVKQLVDLLRQIGEATEASGIAADVGPVAEEAAERLWRGVVAMTSVRD